MGLGSIPKALAKFATKQPKAADTSLMEKRRMMTRKQPSRKEDGEKAAKAVVMCLVKLVKGKRRTRTKMPEEKFEGKPKDLVERSWTSVHDWVRKVLT